MSEFVQSDVDGWYEDSVTAWQPRIAVANSLGIPWLWHNDNLWFMCERYLAITPACDYITKQRRTKLRIFHDFCMQQGWITEAT